jgi:hypothetical protein
VQPADQLLELLHRARRGQIEVADVIVEVDLGIVDPHRMVDLERHRHQLLAEDRHEVHPPPDVRLVVLVELSEYPAGSSTKVSPATCIGVSGVSMYKSSRRCHPAFS